MEINPTQHPAVAATSPARRAVPRLLLATLVALPLTLAACTPQTEPPPAPLPMPSVNTTTPESGPTSPPVSSPSATGQEAHVLPEEIEPPVPSDVAQENSFDGAEAYAYFLFQAWWYLINTHDIDWWDTNIPDCEWKQLMRDRALDKNEKGVTTELSEFTPYVVDSRMNPDNHSEFVVTLQAKLGDIYTIDREGNKTTSVPAQTHQFAVRVVFSGDAWDVVALVNKEAPDQTR